MDKKDLSIVTITWARDDREEAVLRTALKQLAELDLPVFVTDGGSGASFLAFLRNLPQVTLTDDPKRGVWPQTRNSLSAAYRARTPFVLYTEPDKAGFFAHALPRLLEVMGVDEQVGVVLFSRSAAGFTTVPAFQQMTETTINQCCAEVIGPPADYVYGPFLLNRTVIPHLAALDDGIGWGWRPYAFNIAKRLGYRVESVAGDFACPVDQREDTPAERIYRMRQLTQNIEGLTLSVSATLEENRQQAN